MIRQRCITVLGLLVVATTVSCTTVTQPDPPPLPQTAGPPGPSTLPQIVVEQVQADKVVLAPEAARPSLTLTVDYSVVTPAADGGNTRSTPGLPGLQFRSRVFIVDAMSNEVVGVQENPRKAVTAGLVSSTESFEVDSIALELKPGHYIAQPVMLAATAERIEDTLPNLYTDWLDGNNDNFSLATGKAVGFQVLDSSADFLERYRLLVDSGRADHVLRGLSELVMHARASGQFALAEREVDRVIETYRSDPDVDALVHVFRLWQADDIVRQGEPDRAARLLHTQLREYPERAVFGKPYPVAVLEQQAAIWRSEGNLEREILAYDRLLSEFAPVDAHGDIRRRRGEAHLYSGNWDRARQDFQVIVSQARRCRSQHNSSQPHGGEICPDAETVTRANDVLATIDSDRSWFFEDATALGIALKQAFEASDLDALDRLAQAPDFQFGNPGGHFVRTKWHGPVRTYFAANMQTGRYRVNVPRGLNFDENLSHTLIVEDTLAPPEAPGHIVLLLQKSAFGAQWRGLGGLRVDDIDDFNPDLPPNGGGGGGGVTPPPPPESLRMKASWAPGTYMRAGGMRLDFDSLFETPIKDFIGSFLHIDKCGSGIPGYFYNTNDTHKGRNIYSIDFVKGATLFCTPGWVPFAGNKCVPNIGAATFEWLDAVEKAITGREAPVTRGAYLKPVHLGHAGLVVNVVSNRSNGDKDGLNRVDIAAWRYPPTSIRALTGSTSFNNTTGTNDSAVVGRLDNIDPLPDFWLKYLHLAHELYCGYCAPSLGMWVDRGRVIGRVDDTGSESFMSHLHLAVYGRPAAPSGSLSLNDWQTRMQHIENDFIGNNDDGKCIKSSNTLITDTDDDGISDAIDNCAVVANPGQEDFDRDDVGDVCSGDRDNDGIPDSEDSCPDSFDWFGLRDVDLDGINDLSLDLDGDGINNSCDPDADGDGVPNEADICIYGDDAADMDGDGDPDFCDIDADGDGATLFDGLPSRNCPPQPDLFPFDPTKIGDYDGDGIDDIDDPCPCAHVNPVCIPVPPVENFGELQRYTLQ